MPSTAVYLVLPSRIALIAASLMLSGVSKSGSPAPRPITSRPAAFSSRALLVTAMVADGLMRASESARKAIVSGLRRGNGADRSSARREISSAGRSKDWLNSRSKLLNSEFRTQDSAFGIQPIEPLSTLPNLIEQVHLRLVDAIAEGTLAPGERLTQEQLADRLGVSRQPISHALQLLKRQGLVVEHGKRGLSVAPVDAIGIRDLYQVRAALDGLAPRLAAERIAASRAPKSAIDDFRAAFAAGSVLAADAGVHEWIEVDVAFHSSIYALSGNPVITETVAELWPHFKRCMGVALVSRERRKSVWEEHAMILEQILAGNPTGAMSAAVLHTEKAGTALYAELRKANDAA